MNETTIIVRHVSTKTPAWWVVFGGVVDGGYWTRADANARARALRNLSGTQP
jgi:hypothetical protein